MQRWQPPSTFSFLFIVIAFDSGHTTRGIEISTGARILRKFPILKWLMIICAAGTGRRWDRQTGMWKKVVAKLTTNILVANLFEIHTAWLLTNTFAKWLMSWCGETGAIFSLHLGDADHHLFSSHFSGHCWKKDKIMRKSRIGYHSWLPIFLFSCVTSSQKSRWISQFSFHEPLFEEKQSDIAIGCKEQENIGGGSACKNLLSAKLLEFVLFYF